MKAEGFSLVNNNVDNRYVMRHIVGAAENLNDELLIAHRLNVSVRLEIESGPPIQIKVCLEGEGGEESQG